MSDGDIALRIRFSFNTACSPMGAVANMRVRKVGVFTLYGHDGHLGQVKWILILVLVHLPIDASYKIWL